jgi:hypothetical protein
MQLCFLVSAPYAATKTPVSWDLVTNASQLVSYRGGQDVAYEMTTQLTKYHDKRLINNAICIEMQVFKTPFVSHRKHITSPLQGPAC